MKRFIFGFLAIFFLLFNTLPYLHIMADDMPTDSQYEMLGAYALSSLITTGEATELDFSDYTESDTSFLIDLGEAIFTGDWSGLVEDGLEWLGDTADSVYDSYKEYVSQWKAEHLGIMYSNWFPDEQISIEYADGSALAKPLRRLFTPPDDDSNVPVTPPDYQFYIDFINGSGFFFANWSNRSIDNTGGNITQFFPYYNYSYVSTDATPPTMNGTGDQWQSAVSSNIIDVNITSNNGSFFYVYNSNNIITGYYYGSPMYGIQFRTNNQGNPEYIGAAGASAGNYTYTSGNFNSLVELFSSLERRVKNVNIYVDGDAWSVVGSSEPTYPIVIPGQLTIYNDQPLEYTFPPDTHIDLPDLTNIIRNAINSSGVVMWSDIADTYVDINGQTAVAVTKIVRNDYDNLYQEQYPYPAMLIGMTENTKFDENLLVNSQGYLEPMVTVVQDTIDVLPSDIVGVLAIGAILTIFAVIINRLLE